MEPKWSPKGSQNQPKSIKIQSKNRSRNLMRKSENEGVTVSRRRPPGTPTNQKIAPQVPAVKYIKYISNTNKYSYYRAIQQYEHMK